MGQRHFYNNKEIEDEDKVEEVEEEWRLKKERRGGGASLHGE